MEEDDVWAAIDAHRLRTAELLEQLSDDEWQHRSLCEGWTVRDVAAHLTMQQMGVREALLCAIRRPGGMNRMIRQAAERQAGLPRERIIAQIRGMVGLRRHNIGVTCQETLIDILVHSQDIAIPLSRRLDVDPEVAAVAAMRVWFYAGGPKAKVFKKIQLAGLRFTATDTPWSVGSGREIEGPMIAILLVLTGRLAGLSMLSGEGKAVLTGS
ncbi:maleylpyruvate isomerase family mycothiol-dependent enzyme [Mycobacterium sp.]|uniref:maleylpyruvate isomerase family mycothiol-dependent enzyme n=1 Tax=Mycobacterium sp. TaxID=1785 RepID=UPI002CB5BA9F|nr:maleylpyruvate isomerase family mycothiol-dependent enzyme [Mycobacterium sp.]HKP44372.1 maleylpyruvate isomerase family mycothiol-dependent enzyme [Mycobacterium sp.]